MTDGNPGDYYEAKTREADHILAQIKHIEAVVKHLQDEKLRLERLLELARYMGD